MCKYRFFIVVFFTVLALIVGYFDNSGSNTTAETMVASADATDIEENIENLVFE